MIRRTVESMYATGKANEFLEVTYANGETEMLYFKDFNSGAVIQQRRGPGQEVGDQGVPASGERACAWSTCCAAVVEEFREHEDMPNTTNPDDWARISGKKGERITYIRTIVQDKDGRTPGAASRRRTRAAYSTGQYL